MPGSLQPHSQKQVPRPMASSLDATYPNKLAREASREEGGTGQRTCESSDHQPLPLTGKPFLAEMKFMPGAVGVRIPSHNSHGPILSFASLSSSQSTARRRASSVLLPRNRPSSGQGQRMVPAHSPYLPTHPHFPFLIIESAGRSRTFDVHELLADCTASDMETGWSESQSLFCRFLRDQAEVDRLFLGFEAGVVFMASLMLCG
ncbi:hypothetical protein BDP81DRAFT_192746 [Colletotrichum phormii]|uniref:Uncharacterized protein n=1 Tax=Colletotrichum phormii TaxID=359342 RepID=A0AAJ0EHC2_9PEZI|nr:uncharacterized protein BDP81DRAFT_192746 [Colletotrichum phormii]KAK1638859.1 hypothetical protein BDP81DRAFT_192746 [Colletotrichum phormii]